MVAPAGTPPDILLRINREIEKVVKSPGIRQRALGFGLGVSDAGTPKSTGAFIRSEQERWRGLVKELGNASAVISGCGTSLSGAFAKGPVKRRGFFRFKPLRHFSELRSTGIKPN